MDSDDSIRQQIAAVIEGVAPLAVVFPWWVLGDDYAQWPGVLRADAKDLDPSGKKRVHAYVIKRDDSDGKWSGIARVKRTYRYQIIAFHYFFFGSKFDNSEKLFTAEIDAIADKFDHPENFTDHSLKRAQPIRWISKVVNKGFGETLHVGFGSLELHPC